MNYDPLNGDLNYVLTLLYLNAGNTELATGPMGILLQYHSDNPDYASLLSRFKQVKPGS
ncbi:MAG TPA: hypothetical protein VFW78_00580 [Bacteroidia bacterium]|nr:hypothetical protein [Bacteroidia bacterium]